MNTEGINDKFMAGVSAKPVDDRTHATVSRASTKERIKIIFNESDRPEDQNEVVVGVNGRMYQYQRGKEVGVPPEVIHVLDNAVIDKAVPQVTEDGRPNGFIMRPTKRFPYQFVDPDGLKVYREWLQKSLDLRKAMIEAESPT